MPSIETVEFIGASLRPYSFDVFLINTLLGKNGAIYAITKRLGSAGAKDHVRIYVGETDNLRDLVQNHPNRPCFLAFGADCICIHPEGARNMRVRIAQDLLAGYAWGCNPRVR